MFIYSFFGYFFAIFVFVFVVYCAYMIIAKAEEAAHESRKLKQDRYAEMRRRKDEEHEAREHALVGRSL